LISALRRTAATQQSGKKLDAADYAAYRAAHVYHRSKTVRGWILFPEDAAHIFALWHAIGDVLEMRIASAALRHLRSDPVNSRQKGVETTTGALRDGEVEQLFRLSCAIAHGVALQTQLSRGRWFSRDEEVLLMRYAGYLRAVVIGRKPSRRNTGFWRMDIAREEDFFHKEDDAIDNGT
jgi:hypothetical protein